MNTRSRQSKLLSVVSPLFLLLLLVCWPVRLAAQQPQIANQGGNNPPKAIPGPNQKIGVHPNVLAVPTLDGSQSNDPDFDVITYQWKDQGGNVIGTGPTMHLVLAFPGTYTYALTVCDTSNACNSNSTQVEVVIDLLAPVIDAPDFTVSVTDPGSATVSKSTPLSNYVLSGATTSAVDDVDPHPHFLRVEANNTPVTSSTVFPEGDTPVNVFYADQAGNIGVSPATVHVVDRQDNDIFVQDGVGNCFGTPCNDDIQRIRGSSVQEVCSLAGGSSPLQGLIMDSSGRIISLRAAVNIAGSGGLELIRCNVLGAPPEKLAFFQSGGGLPAGYPEPFPGLHVLGPPSGLGGGGLHLARLRTVVIDDNQNNGNPFVVNEDAYVFDLVLPNGSNGTNKSVMYHVKQNFWEDGPQLGPIIASGQHGTPASMYFHSGVTYATKGGCLDRTKIPLSIHATGTLGGVNFDLQLGLFGSSGEICGWVLDNVSGPHLNSPQCTGPAPTDGSGFAVMDGFYAVLFDDYKGYGLTLITNSGATGLAGGGVFNAFSELPFDDPANPGNFFQNPLFGCAITREVRFDPQIPPPPGSNFWGPSSVASTPNGLVGTSPFSNGGIVFTMDPGGSTPIVKGIGYVGGVAAWPPNVSAGAAISVLIRIDSPVDVLVTDPNGKKLGMQNGVPVNDFGNDGFDSGAGSHPHFYAINNPAAGDFAVQSIGTGTGPYTVHVYSLDTSKPFGQHILSSGHASPGVLSNQNFTIGAGGGISFTNHSPAANAGPDQAVNAAANGNAAVNLDGSASSDPDGDTLTFTWAGPFGLASGAQPQITLPVGVNVLSLTVDDGKGGSASSSVTITVNASADTTPPVLTLPANIIVQATNSSGAVVNFSASATDAVDGSVPVTCVPVSGSTFALGTTTVNCSASDASNNSATGSFSVTVNPPAQSGLAQIAASIAGQGRISIDGFYVDLLLSNTGDADALNTSVRELQFTTLSGSGSVKRIPKRTVLPINIGTIPAGASRIVRLYLAAPPSVSLFSLTVGGRYLAARENTQRFSLTQSLTP